jgi:phage tail-like protein
MRARKLEPLLGTSHFRVLIGEHEIGFSEISGLSSETELSAPAEAPRSRFETVVLRRALTRSTELYEWRRSVAAGHDDRRDVTIEQLDAAGGSVVNAWKLVHAWPRRWSGPAFNSLENGVAYEELELAFDDLVWLDESSKQQHRSSSPRATTEGA